MFVVVICLCTGLEADSVSPRDGDAVMTEADRTFVAAGSGRVEAAQAKSQGVLDAWEMQVCIPCTYAVLCVCLL